MCDSIEKKSDAEVSNVEQLPTCGSREVHAGRHESEVSMLQWQLVCRDASIEALKHEAKWSKEAIKILREECENNKNLANRLGETLARFESPTVAKMKDALNRIVHAHDEHIKLQNKSWSEALAWAQDIAQKALE